MSLKVLLIDNYDSFTFNIVNLLRKVTDTEVKVLPYHKIDKTILKAYDKIIISPGADTIDKYPKLEEVVSFCKEHYKSLLGICLGYQFIAVYFGAKLYQLDTSRHGIPKQIDIIENSILYKSLENKVEVGLYHSWGCKNIPKCLKVTALDEGVVMSVEHIKYPIYGIQYHLESFLTLKGEVILKNFLEC